MDEPISVIWSEMSRLTDLIKDQRYSDGVHIADDMHNLASKLLMDDEMVLCKIMLDGLTSIHDIIQHHEISNKHSIKLNSELLKIITKLNEAHAENNDGAVYNALKLLQHVFVQFINDSKVFQKSARYDFLQRPLITADSDEEEDSDEGDN